MIGAIFGRWWRVTLLVSAVGWPILLAATGAMSVGPALLGVSGLAVLNTGAGVLFHQIILRGGRRLRRAMATCLRPVTSAGVVPAGNAAAQASDRLCVRS